MSSTIRPFCRAAQLAAIRISELSNNSDENVKITTDNSIERARKLGYDNTIYVVRYLLNEFNKAQFEDEKTEIATQMFGYLNSNPSILVHEPKFRETVIKKINDINKLITVKDYLYKKAQYDKAIKMMKISMLGNIRNSKMRTDIYKHLNEISLILDDYSKWSNRTQLRNQMNKLLNNIHNNTK